MEKMNSCQRQTLKHKLVSKSLKANSQMTDDTESMFDNYQYHAKAKFKNFFVICPLNNYQKKTLPPSSHVTRNRDKHQYYRQ